VHVIAWRRDLESRELEPSTIRRKLWALSSLFDYLCERTAIAGNPVDGVKRPMANGNEGSTPALGDGQARTLLDAPPADTLKGRRDRAILATFAVSRHPPRGTLPAESPGCAKPARRRSFSDSR
jgi:site-specific recombinase XerC